MEKYMAKESVSRIQILLKGELRGVCAKDRMLTEKGLSLEGTLKEGKGEISKLYLFTTSSYVSCSCYCNNNPKSNMYSGKVYNTKNVLIVVKML